VLVSIVVTYLKENLLNLIVSPVVYFATESTENRPEGKKERKGKYGKRGAHTFPFLPSDRFWN
jgi:hypothetical protein